MRKNKLQVFFHIHFKVIFPELGRINVLKNLTWHISSLLKVANKRDPSHDRNIGDQNILISKKVHGQLQTAFINGTIQKAH